MGRSALNSHAKGKKHKEKEDSRKSLPITFFRQETVDKPSTSKQSADTSKEQSNEAQVIFPQQKLSQCTLPFMMLTSNVTEAEILWAIWTCLTHSSLRSCDGISKLFSRMFSDSNIAKSFSLARTKCGYFINFGVAPYLKDQLLSIIDTSTFFVVFYDESMNRIFQEELMDIGLRYFNDDMGLVETKYFDSAFLKRPNSENLHEKLLQSLSDLMLEKLLEISMDGPNVNWDVLKRHSQYREEKELAQLVIIGSCGLHVVNGAFRTGVMETDWDIHKVLHAEFFVFDESPARRDVYIKETGSEVFPLHFCKTRWVEDKIVASRTIQIWPDISKVVRHWLSLVISKQPQNKSFDVLVKHHADLLMLIKLHFLKFIASILSPFLRRFQMPKPMIPFFSTELDATVRPVISLFLQRQVIEEATTSYKLLKIDLGKRESMVDLQNVDLGTAANSALNKSKVKDDLKMKFREDCVKILVKLIEKLKERSPLSYGVVCNPVCFLPREMVNHGATSELRAKNLIQKFYDLKLLSFQEADKAKQEYQAFLTSVAVTDQGKFLSYDMDKNRLNSFLSDYMEGVDKFANLWKVCKIIFTLSHGQADIERGFSVNEELLIENMKQKSLVSQRLVCDQLSDYTNQLHEYKIEKKLFLSCKSVRMRYENHLREESDKKEESQKSKKRKALIDEIVTAKKVRQDLIDCIASLEADITKYSQR